MAIDKPAGLLVHKSDIDRHETQFAVQLLRDQIGQHVYPIHRLDKGTSGILLFALDAQTCAHVVNQFTEASVTKHYTAIVRGWPTSSQHIDHPLTRIKDPYDKPREKCEPQSAQTDVRVLNKVSLPLPVDKYPEARYALVEATPLTGRRHQIRRHLKHIAHPIIGDVRYGKGPHNRFFREHLGIGRMLLACTALQFQHPITQQRIKLDCEVGDEFHQAFQAFGWD